MLWIVFREGQRGLARLWDCRYSSILHIGKLKVLSTTYNVQATETLPLQCVYLMLPYLAQLTSIPHASMLKWPLDSECDKNS